VYFISKYNVFFYLQISSQIE